MVHHVHRTAANVADIAYIGELPHGEENGVYADARYFGVEKLEEYNNFEVIWQFNTRHSTDSQLNKNDLIYKDERKIEYLKAQTRAKVEHPSLVINRQFGYVKVDIRGILKKHDSTDQAVRTGKLAERKNG